MSGSLAKPSYSFGEEIANSVLHGLGILASIVGLAVLVGFSARDGDAWHVVSCSIFGGTLILLYTSSTLYHSIPLVGAKRFFRTLDHLAIFLLIAGTYTPFTLITLRGSWGWTLFAVAWTLALLGVVVELTPLKRFRAAQISLYLGMSWIALLAIKPLIAALPLGGLILLFGGGVLYTLGVVFYLWRSLPYHHAIWHGFVLAGSVLHYFAILLYVLP
jgi:hemolysin III